MPILLIIVAILGVVLSEILPLEAKSFILAVSLMAKSLIVFLLPIIVFTLLFKSALHFASRATQMVALIFAGVVLSNFSSTLLNFFTGKVIYNFDLAIKSVDSSVLLSPMWGFSLPFWISNDVAMLCGLILGFVFAKFFPFWGNFAARRLEKLVNIILKIVLYIIPLFMLGFAIKMQHENMISTILFQYSFIFVVVLSITLVYISFIFLLLNKFNIKLAIQSFSNMLPAAIAGFGSMSSAAAMPLTIIGAAKNVKDKDLAGAVVPVTVNIHLIGDCFAIPIFAFAVMKTFGVEAVSLSSYLIFAIYFVMAKFSVAAVPGGGIIVMLPILEKYLGFDVQMISLITALYIMFDPVITALNILGNGAFVQFIDKVAYSQSKKTS